ncbi:MAG: CARDB domain-containing protein [Pseudomonadota bacterium]
MSGLQNLVIVALQFDDAQALTGGGLPRTLRIENQGDVRSVATPVRFELIPEGGGDPIVLETRELGPLDPGEGVVIAGSIPFPDDTPLGPYRLRAIIDPDDLVAESNESDDVRVTGAVIEVRDGRADLLAGEVETNDATLHVDAEDRLIDFSFFLENLGLGPSRATTLDLVLEPVGGGDDILLETLDLPIVPPGARATIDDGSMIPEGVPRGEYRWKLILDPGGLVDELDEGNNTVVSTGLLTVVGPELSIDALQTFEATLSRSDPESTVGFSFDVVNTGDGDAPATRAVVALIPDGGGDPIVIREIDVPAIAADGSFEVTGGAPIPQGIPAGVYRWSFTVDADDATFETDEDDNTVLSTDTLTVTDGDPDLTVSAVTLDPAADLVAGAEVEVSFSLDNLSTGYIDAGEVSIRLAEAGGAGEVEIARAAYEALPARVGGASRVETVRVALPRDLASGEYRLSVVVDAGDAVAETNEDNNIGALEPLAIAGLPDGTASDLQVEDDQLVIGDELVFDWTLTNPTGETLAGIEVTAELVAAGGGGAAQEIQRLALADLAPGASVDIDGAFLLDEGIAPGAYVLRVTFDPDDAIAEANEFDNTLLAVLNIAPAPVPDAPEPVPGEPQPIETESPFTRGRDVVTLDGPGVARALGGADEVRGGAWNDEIFGQGGNDDLFGLGGRDKLYGGPGRDSLFGGGGADQAWGGGGADELRLGGGRDRGWGGGGADDLRGDAGNDQLRGGGGNDDLRGGGGRDRLLGERGNDDLWGGGGRDVFVIARNQGRDEIKDFRNGDRVDLTAFEFANFRQVERRLERDGRDTDLDLPGRGELTFARTRPGQLDEDDFIL